MMQISLLHLEMKFENDVLIFQVANGKDKNTFVLNIAKFPGTQRRDRETETERARGRREKGKETGFGVTHLFLLQTPVY